MNALLTPSCELTLGGQRWTTQLLELDVHLHAAPGLNVLRAIFPAAAPVQAGPGDPAEIKLNNGETEARILKGAVDGVRRWETGIEVTVMDAGGQMARYRPATTYEQVTAGSVIRSLASDAGAGTGTLESGDELSFYVADPSRTAWEHAARVAGWLGALVTVNDSNRIESRVVETNAADFALRYGREILSVERANRVIAFSSFTVAGESGVGSTSSPKARIPVTDFHGGQRPEGPDAGSFWEWQPALRTPAAAAKAGTARQRAYGATRDAGRLTAFLQPQARPGMVMEMQDAPDGLPAGPVWISRVRHQVADGRAVTTIWFAAGGGAAGGGLLGSLASAAGGLF
jgi:hypothetical protein